MQKIYFDNAATTPIRPEVIEEMVRVMNNDYGNPSSTHSFGRSSKSILELSRKSIAKNINATGQEIIFTSCGTEANNWILRGAILDLEITRIITSRIEHHAVLHVIETLQKEFDLQVDYVKITPNGTIDMTNLVDLLASDKKTLVSLMHVNNETGVVLEIEKVARLCKQYKVLFHSDCVQSVGKTGFDLQETPIDFLVASAHKFHGPKGVGFAFVRKGIALQPLFYGGEQEKGLRAGTEAVHQVSGMAKALELANEFLVEETEYILDLKEYSLAQLQTILPEIKVNGTTTFYNILNVLLPFSEEKASMLLFSLDMKGIAVSRGSACQSGSSKPSHVLAEMLSDEDIKKPSLRISFSHYNTKAEIDIFIEVLKNI
jgi:cysteine desulfurase